MKLKCKKNIKINKNNYLLLEKLKNYKFSFTISSELKSLFNNKEMNNPKVFTKSIYKNDQENLRRSKREFHNQNIVSNKKSLAKRETNYRTIFENDDIEIQEEELVQEETENNNINRFKRNNKKSKTKKKFEKRKINKRKRDGRNFKNQRIKKRNEQNSKDLLAIFKNETNFLSKNNNNINKLKLYQNKTKDSGEMKQKIEFFVKDGESENDFERRVARQIREKIDAIKEEIKREVDERRKIEDIKENNYMFDELQRTKFDVKCQDFSSARRSLKKRHLNSNSSTRKRKRKRCFAHQNNSKRNKKINSFSSKQKSSDRI